MNPNIILNIIQVMFLNRNDKNGIKTHIILIRVIFDPLMEECRVQSLVHLRGKRKNIQENSAVCTNCGWIRGTHGCWESVISTRIASHVTPHTVNCRLGSATCSFKCLHTRGVTVFVPYSHGSDVTVRFMQSHHKYAFFYEWEKSLSLRAVLHYI